MSCVMTSYFWLKITISSFNFNLRTRLNTYKYKFLYAKLLNRNFINTFVMKYSPNTQTHRLLKTKKSFCQFDSQKYFIF